MIDVLFERACCSYERSPGARSSDGEAMAFLFLIEFVARSSFHVIVVLFSLTLSLSQSLTCSLSLTRSLFCVLTAVLINQVHISVSMQFSHEVSASRIFLFVCVYLLRHLYLQTGFPCTESHRVVVLIN